MNNWRLLEVLAAHWLGLMLLGAPAQAELLQPGDARLRHDIQLLADAGIIDAPVTGWPLFLTGVRMDRADRDGLDPAMLAALNRIFPAREPHESVRLQVFVGAGDQPQGLRDFNDVLREEGELGARFAWEGGRFALDLQASWVSDPADGRESRLDGSYAGVALGNWFVAASATERWWSPGWESSLALSNNARPIPAISVQRREARPTSIRWLRWLGPWTTQVMIGQLESERDVPDARFFGWRFGFRPTPKLEIGLTRTAQWCGEGRPCDFGTFADLLLGKDNRGQNVSSEEEPGNQLAGWDLRYSFNALSRPWAFYTQWIGEDEQNGLPSAHLATLGLETWRSLESLGGSYRAHFEYSETTCSAITDSDPNFGCAYNHGIYRDGYRYRGRAIGHTIDGDGVMATLGGLWVTDAGHTWQLQLRRIEINRSDHPRNSVSPVRQERYGLEFLHVHRFAAGELTLGLSAESRELVVGGEESDETRAFVEWRWLLSGGY
jgi:hypothetical protein